MADATAYSRCNATYSRPHAPVPPNCNIIRRRKAGVGASDLCAEGDR